MIQGDPLKNIRVVLTQPSHPGNIGATARAMKTMGLHSLYLVNPRHFPHADADVRATGAIDVLQNARVCTSLSEALTDCVLSVATSSRHRRLRHRMMNARDAAREIIGTALTQPVALVFGNETSGLSNEEAGVCNLWAYVPTNPEYASLNLAAAVQIFAYEMRMAVEAGAVAQAPEFEQATAEQVDHLNQHLQETMIETGFFDPANPKRLLARLRRLLTRARLESDEVSILRGFLNSVPKKRRD